MIILSFILEYHLYNPFIIIFMNVSYNSNNYYFFLSLKYDKHILLMYDTVVIRIVTIKQT